MTKFSDAVSAKLANVPRISSVTGVLVKMVSGLARVNVQGATVDIRCDGWYPPISGMPVRINIVDGVMRVSGPSQTFPPRGVVQAPLSSGTRASVLADGTLFDLPVLAPYTPTASDTVVINWMSGHVIGKEAAAPTVDEPPSGGNKPTAFSGLVIQPTKSGKYDTNWNNWWGGAEVWASNNNKGIWVYGGRHRALAGADIKKIELYLPKPFKAVGAAFVGLHAYSAIPGGEPAISSLVALPVRSGWIELPKSWGNLLRDNPTWGIGVTSGSGDNRWAGVGQGGGAQSGWLRFAGTR